ncbi:MULTISPECIES: ATP-binding response regulator [Pseudomonadati]|uniref:Response regulator n=1 Tax=Shewanella aestuarii TaxID=1028752 RepID=A0ABT0KYX7_9GAMM|nr:response regulator [Shewanella aestuarii]MCL1116465.1 response regulator [Shewanella aestuarii]GGN71625.1 hypothetical protein GCM10009193_07700 [Shewanella aestuarii]
MQLNQMTAMIIEDMDAMRNIMVEQLRQHGFGRVLPVENSRRALETLENNNVDIVLLDWIMPGGNGIEVLKTMRANPQWHSIPVILVTAHTNRDMVTQAIKYNVSNIIAKPFTAKALQTRVLQALKAERKNLFEQLAPKDPDEMPTQSLVDDTNSILIVDDVPDNLAYLVGLLKDDYKIRFAKNGAAALKICQSATPPDLVLLDIMMPDMDGYQVLKAMREHPQSDQIPVVFVTALTEIEHQVAGLKGGAIDYLTKPIQPDILKLRVKNLLTTVNLQRGLQANYDNILAMAKLKDSVEDIVHHDLKGPLVSISAMAQRIAQDKSYPKELQTKISQIEEMAQQSINTISLFSVLYKIESGRFQLSPERFSIHNIIKRILNVMHVTFHHKKLVAYQIPDEDPNQEFYVMGDPILTYSLLLNLIKNAFEAAKISTKVAIHFESDDKMVNVKIENTGVVPEEIRDTFWDKYVSSGKSKGSGLGTYSAKILTQAQGGTIELSIDDLQNLTSITVSLPVAKN